MVVSATCSDVNWALIAGLSGFAIASAVGGAAQSFGMLTAARAVQGAFGALLAPAALSLLTTTFTEASDRARAFGVFAAIAGSGGSIGLLLGGVLTQTLNWRFDMYVNLVFATVAVAGALILVRNTRPAARPRLDIPGTVAVGAGLFALVYGFAHAQTTSWSDQLTVAMLAGGVLMLTLFVALEARIRNPLLPLRIVGDRNRGASVHVDRHCRRRDLRGEPVPRDYLQQTRGLSPITTGLAFLPMTATIMSFAIVALTRLQSRFGSALTRDHWDVARGSGVAVSRARLDGLRVRRQRSTALIVLGAGPRARVRDGDQQRHARRRPGRRRGRLGHGQASQQVGGSLGIALFATVATSATTHYLAAAHHGSALAERAAVHG